MSGSGGRRSRGDRWVGFAVVGLVIALAGCGGDGSQQPVRIGYSDWPGWVMWEIAKEKGFFAENGVEVELVWMDYVPSMDAFAAGQLDGVSMTNGDALVVGAQSGKPSVGILVNDYSNGNDMVIGRPGIESMADLRGMKVGVEVGFVDHLLLLRALEAHGMAEGDVELVDMATNELPQALANGSVDAVAAWQPNSGQALKVLPGSKILYSSADEPGLIYDLLYVSRESLQARRDEWERVVRAWYQVVDYVNDPTTRDEAIRVLASRVNLTPAEYAPLLEGTYVLSANEAMQVMTAGAGEGLRSLAGSSQAVDAFNVGYGVYSQPQASPGYIDAGLATLIATERGAVAAAD